jgi:prolyl-tRNA synthetase
MLENIQENLYNKAVDFREENIHTVDSYEEFKSVLEQKGGFIYAHWDGTEETEEKIKQETKATIRCIPFGKPQAGECMVTGKPSAQRVVFAKAY